MIRAIGIGADGGRYMFETIAEDVGAGGLCALAPRHLEVGGELCFRIRFSLPRSKSLTAPVVLARGTVLRVRGLPQGGCLFAAAFSRRRIL